MKSISKLLLMLLGIASVQVMAETVRIPIGIYTEHAPYVREAIASGDCPDPRTYPSSHNQVLSEFLIFCEALKLGGLKPAFEIKEYPSYVRLLRELKGNYLAAPAFAIWRRDINESQFHVSPAIIPANRFSKGVFVLPQNTTALTYTTRSQIQQLTAVTNAKWLLDVESIGCIGSPMVSAHSYVNMFRMLKAQRADYLITTFPAGADLSVNFHGVKLSPIPGIKVVFKDSLHFAVSKHHPDGEKIAAALDSGMRLLQRDGVLDEVLARVGLLNPITEGWKNIGCE